MAGTTREVRATGNREALSTVLTEEYNKLLADLETIRSEVNTANGGAISIDAAALTAGTIQYL